MVLRLNTGGRCNSGGPACCLQLSPRTSSHCLAFGISVLLVSVLGRGGDLEILIEHAEW